MRSSSQLGLQWTMVGVSMASAFVALAAGVLTASSPESSLVASTLVLLLVGLWALSLRLHVSASSGARPSPALKAFLAAGAFLLVVYALSFNFLADATRLRLAGLVAVLLFVSGAALILTGERGGAQALLLTGYALIFGFALLGSIVGLHPFHPVNMFRATFPLLFAAGLVCRPSVVPPRATALAAAAVVIGGVAISFSHGTAFLADAQRLTPFTGGALDGIHSSAYVLALSMIILNELRRQRYLSRRAMVSLGLIALAGMAEFKVASAFVLLVVYFGTRIFLDSRRVAIRMLVLVLLASTVAVGYQVRVHEKETAVYGSRATTVDNLSSGRISAWSDRIRQVDSRNVGLLLLGSGVGSDEAAVAVWNGAVKDSHSDVLTLFLEEGLLGLAAYLVLLVVIAKVGGRSTIPIILALASSSVVSNAMFARPMVAPFLWIAVALAARWSPASGSQSPGTDRARAVLA